MVRHPALFTLLKDENVLLSDTVLVLRNSLFRALFIRFTCEGINAGNRRC